MGALIKWFDQQFAQLHASWSEVIDQLPAALIYRPLSESDAALSCGEYIVKSARVVEQSFGGITSSLWDDPFEWTLPETLTTHEKLHAYFAEVEATRRRGFELFTTDEALLKQIMTPSGEMQLASLLLDTLVRARHHQLSGLITLQRWQKTERRDAVSANFG
jgi:hypothetical protein